MLRSGPSDPMAVLASRVGPQLAQQQHQGAFCARASNHQLRQASRAERLLSAVPGPAHLDRSRSGAHVFVLRALVIEVSVIRSSMPACHACHTRMAEASSVPPHVVSGSGVEAALALLLLVGLQLAACNSTDHQEVAQLAYSAFAHEILLAWKTFCCIWHLACLLCQAPRRP